MQHGLKESVQAGLPHSLVKILFETCEYAADFIRFGVAIFQNLIDGERLAALAVALDATG
jgi:hypothetical protein